MGEYRGIAAVVLSALLLAGCASSPGVATTVTVTQPAQIQVSTTTVAVEPTVNPTGKVAPSDGIYIVGTDIEPGTYRSSPTLQNGYPFCTWQRLSGLGGTLSEAIAIENQEGQAFVTIAPSDVAFKTQSCQPWERVG